MTAIEADSELADEPSPSEPEEPREPPIRLPAGTTTLFVLLIASVLATTWIVFFTLNFAVPIRWPAEAWMALGTGLVFGLAGVLYWLHPWWIRRRSRLRELTPENSRLLVEELHGLCGLAGVQPPTFLLAPYAVKSVNGLAFGHARERAVRLDMGLVLARGRSPEGFRAVVLHELAHLRNRDVDLTYLSVAIVRAFVVEALPVMTWLTVRATVAGASPNWWSALLVVGSLTALTLLVYLTRNALLRARELYAEAQVPGWDKAGAGAARRAVLGKEAGSAPPDRLVHRVRDDHPHPSRRLATLEDPELLVRPRLWELFTVGVVAAILLGNGFVFFASV